MPEHILKYAVTGRYLQFNDDSGRVKFVAASEATGFPSPEAAWSKTREAAARLGQTGLSSQWIKTALGAGAASSLSDPEVCRSFESQARPSFEDIAGVMELTYLRSASQGWLCRNWRKGDGPHLVWEDDFTFAVAFPDPETARKACPAGPGSDVSLFKTSAVFVAVEALPGAEASSDPIRDGLRAAFEAREIKGEIESGARERLAALSRSQSETPARPLAKKARAL